MSQMLVCDLDGTLLMRGQPFNPLDMQLLHALGERNVVRAIATGRALATAMKVIEPAFPIDYLIFSSGAGILDWRSQQLLASHTLHADETARAVEVFAAHDLDFMLHEPIPAQHIFLYHRSGKANPDFERRLARYAADGRVFEHGDAHRPASQLLAVSPSNDASEPYETLRRELSELSVIRATSPLDHHSMWIEVFASPVSKSNASQWIADKHGIAREHTFAIGNDYNDWDLLRWANEAAVVHGAPDVMKSEFRAVSSLQEWLGRTARS